MAEYSKKLHVLKNDVVTDIKLYTTADEVGSPSFHMLDGATEVYAKLGEVSDTNASPLRVLYSGTTYAVLTQAATAVPTGLYVYPGKLGTFTYTWTVPNNVSVISMAFGRGGEGGIVTGSIVVYVGVTPNKTYTWNYAASLSGGVPGTSGTSTSDGVQYLISQSGIGPGYGGLDIVINWSPDINNTAPTKTSY